MAKNKFEDTRMNPGQGKKDLPKNPTKETIEKELKAIGNNVMGKGRKK